MSTLKNSSREGAVVDACLRYLRKLPRSRWEKRHGTPYGRVGQPDISGCYRGYHVELEVKRPGGHSTERQVFEQQAWRDAGAIVGEVQSAQDCRTMLLSLLTPDDRGIQP